MFDMNVCVYTKAELDHGLVGSSRPAMYLTTFIHSRYSSTESCNGQVSHAVPRAYESGETAFPFSEKPKVCGDDAGTMS